MLSEKCRMTLPASVDGISLEKLKRFRTAHETIWSLMGDADFGFYSLFRFKIVNRGVVR